MPASPQLGSRRLAASCTGSAGRPRPVHGATAQPLRNINIPDRSSWGGDASVYSCTYTGELVQVVWGVHNEDRGRQQRRNVLAQQALPALADPAVLFNARCVGVRASVPQQVRRLPVALTILEASRRRCFCGPTLEQHHIGSQSQA